MSEYERLKDIIPRTIVGSVKYSRFEDIPEDHLLKNHEALLPILKRTSVAGSKACVFYLYNDQMVNFLNLLHDELPDFQIMIIVSFEEINGLLTLFHKLKFKPSVIFFDHSIVDQRDNDIVTKFINSVGKYGDHIGIYSLEPIGTVSFFITSNPKLNIFMFPFNMLGLGLQNRSLMEMIVNSSEYLYIATKPLAEDKLRPRQAYDYITTHKIHGTVLELDTVEKVLDAIKFSKYFFETHDFLQIALEFEDHSEICESCGIGMTRYFPPQGGSWWYCPQCEAKKELP